jgi:hypothetical protein
VDAPDEYEEDVVHGRDASRRSPGASTWWDPVPGWWDGVVTGSEDRRPAAARPAQRRRCPRRRGGSIGAVDAVVFRPSRVILLVAVLLALCATPVAFGAPFLWLVYLAPLGVVAWVLLTRTTVTPDAVTVRRFTGTRRVPWESISSLRLVDTTRVAAVLDDGSELPLPAVGARDLPRLAAASGGRLPDPSGD